MEAEVWPATGQLSAISNFAIAADGFGHSRPVRGARFRTPQRADIPRHSASVGCTAGPEIDGGRHAPVRNCAGGPRFGATSVLSAESTPRPRHKPPTPEVLKYPVLSHLHAPARSRFAFQPVPRPRRQQRFQRLSAGAASLQRVPNINGTSHSVAGHPGASRRKPCRSPRTVPKLRRVRASSVDTWRNAGLQTHPRGWTGGGSRRLAHGSGVTGYDRWRPGRRACRDAGLKEDN